MYILSKRESEDDDASILLVVAESSTIDYTLSSISRALDGRCIELLQQLLILKVKSVKTSRKSHNLRSSQKQKQNVRENILRGEEITEECFSLTRIVYKGSSRL